MELEMDIKNTKEYAECVKAGRDAEKIIADAMQSERYQKYKSEATRLSILKAALIKTVTSELDGDPFDETVMIFGGADQYGSKRPVNFLALKKDKTFVKITAWDSGLVEAPCKCRIQGVYDAKWNSVTPLENGISEVVPADMETCQKALMKVAISVKDIDKLESLVKYNVYAFTGAIQWVNPTPVFADGRKTGENALLADNENVPPRKHVTAGISIDSRNSGFSITLHLDRQRVGSPVVEIEDFEALAIDAVESFPGEPKRQCSVLRDGITGRDIIAIGSVNGIKEQTPKNGGDPICYINASCAFIMEANSSIKPAPAPKLADYTPEEYPDVIDPVDTSLSPEQKIVADIVTFACVNNQDPTFIPTDKVRSIAKIGAEYDDNLIGEFKKAAGLAWNAKKKEE